nr:immunoglobulin light chain junction region [Macaca mulatta]
CLQYTKDPFTF